jgi:hypothetical protein
MTDQTTTNEDGGQASPGEKTCGCGPDCKCGPDCACGPNGTCNPACTCAD